MDLFRILKKGAVEAASSYKLLLTVWVITLVMIMFVALPLRSSLKSVFGDSMATERLSDGFDMGLAGDMGKAFGQLMASATTGGLLLVLAGFLLYTFFAGGLFTRFTIAWGGLKVAAFLKASAHNFVPFLMIALLMCLIIGVYTALIIGIPTGVMLAVRGGSSPLSGLMKIFYILWGLGLPVWLFVADYSRRWIAATDSHKVFRALGEGFKALKKRFWISYTTVLVIFILNVVFVIGSMWFTAWSIPEKGIMVFLFFLATQLLFLVRLFMKAWRYASVSELALLPERKDMVLPQRDTE
jgi:hypothetical protein